jgi:hypothetical protein
VMDIGALLMVHSPWTRDTKDPQPICIEDLDRAELPDL